MKTKKRTYTDEYVEHLVRAIALPHRRYPGGKWLASNRHGWFIPSTQSRFQFYVRQLLELGMPEIDIVCMLGDLAWDSFLECLLNKIPEKMEAEQMELKRENAAKMPA